MSKVSFVILHYKDIEITDCCVQSILKMDHREDIQIVLVDNDVQELPVNRQKLINRYKEEKTVTVLQIVAEGGFSYANNQGYAYAVKNYAPEYIVICNNDIEFIQADFVDKIKQTFEKTQYAVLGPDVVRRGTGEHQNPMDSRIRTVEEAEYTIRMNRMGLKWYHILYPVLFLHEYISERKKMRKKENNNSFYLQSQEEIVPFGACLVFSKIYIEKQQKAFEPETPFYYEEYILAYQCKKKGYRIVYDPEIQVWHESGSATKTSYRSEKQRMRFRMEKTLNACEIYRRLLKRV